MHFVDAKGILSGSGGRWGMNIYRGCSHGCIYCDSRSRCYQFTHPFEDIEVKRNAPELLEAALRRKRKKCMIATGSMSDPYMHCEEQLGLTRKCLEIILRCGFGATLLTKSDRVLRDIDLLEEINRRTKCVVQMTLTTFDNELCRVVEPHVCPTQRRIEVLAELHRRSIPTVAWLSPILPSISACGVRAATESTTITSSAPDLHSCSQIVSASSPELGCETRRLSRSTPIFFAYVGSSACSASINAATPPAFCALATT